MGGRRGFYIEQIIPRPPNQNDYRVINTCSSLFYGGRLGRIAPEQPGGG